MLEIVLIAISLAFDCLAVSIAGGVVYKNSNNRVKYALKVGVFFGLFQMLMPLLGWWAGYSFKNLISNFDHWIAFGLLAIIGIKMIYEGSKAESDEKKKNIINNGTLIILSVATSIDALAVGITFGLIKVSPVFSILIIGFFSFMFSFIGFMSGSKAGNFFKGKIEIIGGAVLILIGAKIILEHLFNLKLL